MTVSVPIPGLPDLHLEQLLLDVNGTMTNRGALMGTTACTGPTVAVGPTQAVVLTARR